jgi:hypothetical protein
MLLSGPEGPEPALVSLVSTDDGLLCATAAAAVGGSEAPRGHFDSWSSRRSRVRLWRDVKMTRDIGQVLVDAPFVRQIVPLIGL